MDPDIDTLPLLAWSADMIPVRCGDGSKLSASAAAEPSRPSGPAPAARRSTR